jgi:hypothetical protein
VRSFNPTRQVKHSNNEPVKSDGHLSHCRALVQKHGHFSFLVCQHTRTGTATGSPPTNGRRPICRVRWPPTCTTSPQTCYPIQILVFFFVVGCSGEKIARSERPTRQDPLASQRIGLVWQGSQKNIFHQKAFSRHPPESSSSIFRFLI